MTHSESGGWTVFNFSNSFLFSSHFFIEISQLLYIKSIPSLLTISACCQGVNQKAQVSPSLHKQQTLSVQPQTLGTPPEL